LIAGLPKNIEVSLRIGESHKLWFLLNHSPHAETLSGVPAGLELISDAKISGSLDIEPLGVAVIKQPLE
jgi:hypothetical protein